jgi:hypothetical protein
LADSLLRAALARCCRARRPPPTPPPPPLEAELADALARIETALGARSAARGGWAAGRARNCGFAVEGRVKSAVSLFEKVRTTRPGANGASIVTRGVGGGAVTDLRVILRRATHTTVSIL